MRPITRRSAGSRVVAAVLLATWFPCHEVVPLLAQAPGTPPEAAAVRVATAQSPEAVSQLPSRPQPPLGAPVTTPPAVMAQRLTTWEVMAVAGVMAIIVAVALAVAFVGNRITRAVRLPPDTGPFAVDPGELAFGLQRRNEAAVRRVGITSHAAREVVVSSVAVSGEGFALASSPALPLTLHPGERMEADILFESSSECRCTGSVTVRVNTAPGLLKVRLRARVD